MPVSVSFEQPKRFILQGTGKITGAECIRALEEVLSDPRLVKGTTILAVTHDVTGAPGATELRDIVVVTARLSAQGMTGFHVVTEPGFTYGVARMFASLADLAGIRVDVFQDEVEARSSLDEVAARAA